MQFNVEGTIYNNKEDPLGVPSQTPPHGTSDKPILIGDVETNAKIEIRYVTSTIWPKAEQFDNNAEKIVNASIPLPEDRIIAHRGTYWFVSPVALSLRGVNGEELAVVRTVYKQYHLHCIWVEPLMSIDFHGKGRFLDRVDCVVNELQDVSEANTDALAIHEIDTPVNKRKAQPLDDNQPNSKRQKTNETNGNDLDGVLDMAEILNNNFRVVRYARVKNVGTRHTIVDQRNKRIIDIAEPLPEGNRLTPRAAYWFVTIEEVDLIFGDTTLFVWKERTQIEDNGVIYYLNQVEFSKNKSGVMHIKFLDESEIHIHCTGTSKLAKRSSKINIESTDVQATDENNIFGPLMENFEETGVFFENDYLYPPVPLLLSGIPEDGMQLALNEASTDVTPVKLGRKIGEGSYGVIYMAEWNNRLCAVKRFKFADVKRNEIIKETEALQRLQHECIVALTGVTTDPTNDETMLVMEYMEDGSLADAIRDKIQLLQADIVQIALDVANGLQYLHSQKIIHRDLKSGNVLLYNNKKRAKLSDFGTVRIFDKSSKATTIVGTMGFMAPEILHEEPYNAKADVYSFGALLFQMITTKTFPMMFKNLEHAKTKIKSEVSVVEFQELIIDCCKLEPDERPTIEECIDRLKTMS